MSKKILVLEDEESIRSFVVINLRRVGYETVEFSLGQDAIDYLKNNNDISIAVLDVMLPDIDGFEVCTYIRGSGSRIGVIMLTARAQETDRVTGLMTGADDYVTKPFSVLELTARVDALYRRIHGSGFNSEMLSSGDFVLDMRSRELEFNKKKVELTQVECTIIKTFFENPGKALSRDEIMELVWGNDYQGDLKVVDVNIRRLRLKIEKDPAAPKHLLTIWGYGYKWIS